MHLFHPLRPLTDSGRALVCLAASVFAALLLVAWSPSLADDANPDGAATVLTCAPAAR